MSFVDLRELAFFWQNNFFEQHFQFALVIWTMKTFVIADWSQVLKTLLCLFDDGYRYVAISDFFHDWIVDEILDKALEEEKQAGKDEIAYQRWERKHAQY